MTKMGLPKRMFWIWSNICYGLFVGYILNMILNQTMGQEKLGEELCFLSVPTMFFEILFKEAIYEDKINWKSYANKRHQRLIPILILVVGIWYGVFKSNSNIVSLAAGFLITYIITLIIAVSECRKSAT